MEDWRRNGLLKAVSGAVILALSAACGGGGGGGGGTAAPSREDSIPPDAVKWTPRTDLHPPELHSSLWETPVPVPGAVNTAGAEDSPFILPDGDTLYFFFTPDVAVPPEQQVLDGVTGIYVSRKTDGLWQEAERVVLQDPGKLSLDGCACVQGDVLWFCSAREGVSGLGWFAAEDRDGAWADWQAVDFGLGDDVGEIHVTPDDVLYFASTRSGGLGGWDIWVSRKVQGRWGAPENLAAVNSAGDESQPFLSSDGTELWFTRTYEGTPAVFRSERVNGTWQAPELVISRFAGEPTVDRAGNIYFVHHFYDAQGTMAEGDIYVAERRAGGSRR